MNSKKFKPKEWYVIMKLTEAKHKKCILKTARKSDLLKAQGILSKDKSWFFYRKHECLNAVGWHIQRALKITNHEFYILHNYPSKNEELEKFPDKEKLREATTSRPA